MQNVDDRYLMPFGVGSELSAESFSLSQMDNTYLLAGTRYYQFYSSYIKPRINMYNGWVQGYHNMEYGVIPSLFIQSLGESIKAVVFGKPIILNTSDAKTNEIIATRYRKARFNQTVKESYGYALAGGTGLIKLNKDGQDNLRFEAVPMDKFFVETDAYGDIERVKSFLATYHDTIYADTEYYLCEERFFRYTIIAGKQVRFPFAHYLFYKTSGNMANETTPSPTSAILWQDVPRDIRNMLKKDYGDIYTDNYDSDCLYDLERKNKPSERARYYDNCKLLPFNDDLGCRLIKFTDNIPAFPKMPFGRPLADFVMNEAFQYDQLKFFERLEVYLARGRVAIDEDSTNPNDPDGKRRAVDPIVFTYIDKNMAGSGSDGKPEVIQFALRAEDIRTQKMNILNDCARSLHISSSTLASWLSDGTTQKTATEIEYERTATESFINNKIDIIQEPLQELVDLYFHYYKVSSPELHIMPENQNSRSDNIKLFSELYEKREIPARMLAEKILGTCSIKEVNKLTKFMDEEQNKAEQNNIMGNIPPQTQ